MLKKSPGVFSVLLVIAVIALSVSCRKENLYKTFNKGEPWRITWYSAFQYTDTTEFPGYVLRFKKNNVVEASKGGVTVNGSWGQTTISDQEHLILSFPESDTTLRKLNETWSVGRTSPGRYNLGQRSPNRDKHLTIEQ